MRRTLAWAVLFAVTALALAAFAACGGAGSHPGPFYWWDEVPTHHLEPSGVWDGGLWDS